MPTGVADAAPLARNQTGLGGVAQSPPPQKVPLACTAQPPPTRVNWYPALSAGRPPIVSERPVAGQNQAGCVPETGSRRLSSQVVVPPDDPVRADRQADELRRLHRDRAGRDRRRRGARGRMSGRGGRPAVGLGEVDDAPDGHRDDRRDHPQAARPRAGLAVVALAEDVIIHRRTPVISPICIPTIRGSAAMDWRPTPGTGPLTSRAPPPRRRGEYSVARKRIAELPSAQGHRGRPRWTGTCLMSSNASLTTRSGRVSPAPRCGRWRCCNTVTTRRSSHATCGSGCSWTPTAPRTTTGRGRRSRTPTRRRSTSSRATWPRRSTRS